MSRMITLAFYATHRREENGLYTEFTSIVVGGGRKKLMYEKGKKNKVVSFFLCKHPSVPILYIH